MVWSGRKPLSLLERKTTEMPRKSTTPADEIKIDKKVIKGLIQRDEAVLTSGPDGEFVMLCTFLFGGERWGTKAAKVMKCSPSHVSHYRTGKNEPAKHHVRKLLKYAREHAEALLGERVATGDDDVETLDDVPELTDEQIRERFDGLSARVLRYAKRTLKKKYASLIISGNGGCGKSYLVTLAKSVLNLSDDDVLTYKGEMTGPGLFRALWQTKDGGVLVLDDCDDALFDAGMMNMLKGALDSIDKRVITYAKMANWIEEEGMEYSFEYKGSVIFVTNYDIAAMANGNTSMAPHMDALMSRSQYLDMTIRSRREMAVKIEMLIEAGMLDNLPHVEGAPDKLTAKQKKEITKFVVENRDRFRQYSLRTAIHVANTYRAAIGEDEGDTWKEDCEEALMGR